MTDSLSIGASATSLVDVNSFVGSSLGISIGNASSVKLSIATVLSGSVGSSGIGSSSTISGPPNDSNICSSSKSFSIESCGSSIIVSGIFGLTTNSSIGSNITMGTLVSIGNSGSINCGISSITSSKSSITSGFTGLSQ